MKRTIAIALTCLSILFILSCEKPGRVSEPSTPTPNVPPPTSCPGALTFSDDATTFSFVSSGCGAGLQNAGVRVGWFDTDRLHTASSADYPDRKVETTNEGYRWTLRGHASAPELAIDAQTNADGTQITLRANATWPATKSADIRLAWVELPSAPAAPSGVRLAGTPGRASWMQNGHDAWTFTGVEALNVGEGRPTFIAGTVPPCADDDHYLDTCHGVSWWMGALASLDRGPGLLWGALAAAHWKTHAAGWYDQDGSLVRFVVAQGTPGDERAMSPGATLPLEPIWLMLAARPSHDLRQYASAAATETPPLEPDRPAPFGWATWYFYFKNIDQQTVLDNCRRMRELFPDVEPLVCQIDDGYETLVGDWTSYTAGFPDGMGAAAQAIDDLNMIAGIWIAPLMVDEHSALVADHPDWFLYDVTGRPVLFEDPLSNMRQYALDITAPGVADHVRQIIADKAADGFRYLKLDFLLVGSFEGAHADGSTSLEAYHQAMAIIGDAAGPDVYLLACGQPWLPTLGHFHAARDSSDVAGSTPGFPLYTTYVNNARSHTVRAAMDGVWFANDPDDLVVRPPLTGTQAQVAVAMTYLAGRANLLGDSLTKLPGDRTTLVTSAAAEDLRGVGGSFWATDLMERAVAWPIATPAFDVAMVASNPPRIWVRAVGDDRIVALFAWGLLDDELFFDDHDLALDRAAQWTVTHLLGVDAGLARDANGMWSARVPGQSVAVYRLTPQ
jgi:alpha-galactosidase